MAMRCTHLLIHLGISAWALAVWASCGREDSFKELSPRKSLQLRNRNARGLRVFKRPYSTFVFSALTSVLYLAYKNKKRLSLLFSLMMIHNHTWDYILLLTFWSGMLYGALSLGATAWSFQTNPSCKYIKSMFLWYKCNN